MKNRLQFSIRLALLHFFLSAGICLLSGFFVFGLLYPSPYRHMLGVGHLFGITVLIVMCTGPLLTLILANPKKSRPERHLDFAVIGLLQAIALFYGMYMLWLARPAIVAFEVDRLVVVTASEIDTTQLTQAPSDFQDLPYWGVLHVGTRKAKNAAENFESMNLGLVGISPAMRPEWWTPWQSALGDIKNRIRPVTDLKIHHMQDMATLQKSIIATGLSVDRLRYLPITHKKTKDWIVLFNTDMEMVGYAPLDGF